MESGDDPYGCLAPTDGGIDRCFHSSLFGSGKEPCEGREIDGVMARCASCQDSFVSIS